MNTYTHVRLGSRSRPFVSEGLKCPKNYDNYLCYYKNISLKLVKQRVVKTKYFKLQKYQTLNR